MTYKSILLSLVALHLAALPARALTATQTVEREIVVLQADGTQLIKREKADLVTPGDTIVYTLNYYNDKDETADNITLVMPIPAQISYLEGSADMEAAHAVYSADGGKTFAARAGLQFISDDGLTRPARAEDITHIRWRIKGSIAPEGTGSLSFSGRLK